MMYTGLIFVCRSLLSLCSEQLLLSCPHMKRDCAGKVSLLLPKSCGRMWVFVCRSMQDTGCYCVVSCKLSPLYLRERNYVIQYIGGSQNILNTLDHRKISCIHHYRALTKLCDSLTQ